MYMYMDVNVHVYYACECMHVNIYHIQVCAFTIICSARSQYIIVCMYDTTSIVALARVV